MHVETQVKEVAERTCAKLSEMNGELARELIPTPKDPKIKWKTLFKYTLESDGGIPMDKRGSGVRRLVLLNFFRAEAERKAEDSGHRPVIYAIEEPETAQHPDHQKMLIKALLEISNNGGQVLISTHAPGLAGEVPIKSLRFIDKNADDRRTVHSADTDEAQVFYNNIAERLGMLPDSLVRVMICVEGINDFRFLRNISHTLHQSDNSLPDLSNDPKFAIVPMNGGNLRDFVNLHIFKYLMKPEFHIYDQDDGGTYRREANTVNARTDRSCAVQTTKRTIENYINPAAFARKAGFEIEITNDNNPVELCNGRLGTKNETKMFLNGEVAEEMTAEEIDERDGSGEIRGWLSQLAELAL
jgi:predicted ATP-dependent endonuclease of OLD family